MRRLALLALAVAAGCGDDAGYDKLELVEVTGRVTLDGAPLAGARVVFESPDKSGAEGVTDADGKYRLMYDTLAPGCRPGPKLVRITTAALVEEGADPDNPLADEKIFPQFNRESKLTAVVSASQKIFDFDLQSQP